MRGHVDLHTHSTFSDGILTPTELISLADEIGLDGIALTDHDTIGGISEFFGAESSREIYRVPGVEITTEYFGLEIHLLGYFIPHDSSRLRNRLKELEISRTERIPKMVDRLREIGIEISQEDVDDALRGVQSPGRPHLARLLIRKGVVKDFQEAFSKYLAEGKPGYVRKERMDTIDAIRLLRELGAVPVLAHPLVIRTENLSGLILELVEQGLLGVETDYDYANIRLRLDRNTLKDAIHGLDLIQTGGSDFHGDARHDQLGRVIVPISVIYDLRDVAEN